MDESDKELNKDWFRDNYAGRLFAKYDIPVDMRTFCEGHEAIYIIHEGSEKESVTTFLYPDEY